MNSTSLKFHIKINNQLTGFVCLQYFGDGNHWPCDAWFWYCSRFSRQFHRRPQNWNVSHSILNVNQFHSHSYTKIPVFFHTGEMVFLTALKPTDWFQVKLTFSNS